MCFINLKLERQFVQLSAFVKTTSGDKHVYTPKYFVASEQYSFKVKIIDNALILVATHGLYC